MQRNIKGVRRATAAAALAGMMILPLMGATKCSSSSSGTISPGSPAVPGRQMIIGNEVYWVGGGRPPAPAAGTRWKRAGQTRKGRPLWIRVPR
jgi:hypothetical protein